MLNYCDNSREARKIIASRQILVDGKIVTDPKRPVGLMDVLTISQTRENFRILINQRGRLQLVPIEESSAKWKLSRIENKTTIKKGKIQLNLHDGRNILLKENDYKTGWTLKIQNPDQKILDCYPLERGNLALLIGGSHVGEIAHVEGYKPSRNPKENIVSFQEGFSTVKKNVFLIGKEATEIVIPEGKAI